MEKVAIARDQVWALPLPQGAKRFFANPEVKGGGWVDELTEPRPFTLTMEGDLRNTGLIPGLYHAVFAISGRTIGETGDTSNSLLVKFIVGTYEVSFNLHVSDAIIRIRLPSRVSVLLGNDKLRVALQLEEPQERTLLLHYFELQDASFDPDPADILIDLPKTPIPIKVLDVNRNEPANGTSASSKPNAILSYAISPSSIYAATLSRIDDQGQIHLWELRSTDTSDFSDAKLAAHGLFDWEMGDIVRISYGLSVSNGGQVVVFQRRLGLDINFTAFTVNEYFTPAGNKAGSSNLGAIPTLAYTPVLQPNTHATSFLKGFNGYGKFVQGAKDDEDYFLFSDGLAVYLYSTAGDWKLLYKRVLKENSNSDTRSAIKLVNGARGGRFAWTGTEGVISVWMLDCNRLLAMVSVAGELLGISFSEDGQRMLVSTFEGSFVYSVNTGTLLIKGRSLGEANFVLGNEQFMCHSKGFMASSGSLLETLSFYRARPNDRQEYTVMPGTSGTLVATSHDSGLMILAVADILEEPCVLGCRPRCLNVRKAGNRYKDNFVVSDDLEFRLKFGYIADKFDIAAHQPNEEPRVIHTLHYERETRVFFLENSPFLVIEHDFTIYIWKLPANTVDLMELVLFWNSPRPLRPEPDSESLSGREPSLDDEFDPDSMLQFKITCEHDKSIHLSPLTKTVVLSLCNPLTSDTAEHIFGSFPELIQWYQHPETDISTRAAILQYIGRHFGAYPDLTRPTLSFMSALCHAWDIFNYLDLETILRQLFQDGLAKWVPLNSYTKESSPLSILLEKARTQPKVLGLITIIIEYCVEKAHEERDFIYVSPVLSSLDDLLEVFPDVAAKFLQDLVFIPVKSRSIAINHHAIAYPPTLRRFWIPNQQSLHVTPNPILQTQFSPKKIDPFKDYFTQELFLASYDMLWPKHSTATSGSIKELGHVESWPRMLLALLMLSVGVQTSHSAPLRNFDSLHLDNPAIEALIQYKWNKFAFSAWLIRFVFQAAFYTLVVVAVVVQVYAEDKESLVGIFAAIIAMASLFLWLEFLQFKENWRRYQRSPYNVLDAIVFVLPMVASIHQIVNISRGDHHGNKSALSFSIIVILLHLLSELRVNYSVCKYVTIVLRVLKEIQIFFIVFAAGILAFSLAILHILHGCPVNGCSSGLEGFPTHFFGAISSTYFIMGGRYDPVNQFLNEERWDIHIMMMIYFFFTVILMLNVLIALISIGFNKGDESWRNIWLENRLRYVETAENLTYYVPGFRERFDWFPKEIYYTSTEAQVAAYRTKYDLKDWSAAIQPTKAAVIKTGKEDPSNDNSGPATSYDIQVLHQEMREIAEKANWRARVSDEQLEIIQFEMQERAKAADKRVQAADEKVEMLLKNVGELLTLIRAGKSVVE